MRYELKRNKNGIITQCETNADGGNIYAQREEINKLALENLARPTPGKLGNLSNLQIFNFSLQPGFTGSSEKAQAEYNGSVTTGAVSDCIMFNVDSANNKALYYNIKDIKISVNLTGSVSEVLNDSYIEFYLLENIEDSSTSVGQKIPRRAPVFGTSAGTVNWLTTGAKRDYQSIKCDMVTDSVNIPSDIKGLRCSGLALKSIFVNFSASENLANLAFNFQVFVDVSSVSSTY